MATVSAGGRLHVGFQNLALAHERLYGGIGIGLDEPRVRVRARRAETVVAPTGAPRRYAKLAVTILGVPGVELDVERSLPRHVGFGSGTQLALTIYAATALAYDREPAVREHAPALGRGGRSGVGVATFEGASFVVDAGHPSSAFADGPPVSGEWTVSPVVTRLSLPEEWRFVIVVPDVDVGRNGAVEEASMRSVVERADPSVADEIASIVTRRLLSGARTGDLERFGAAVERVDRLNGSWYTDVQDDVYPQTVSALIEELSDEPSIAGIAQSSWGPAVFGVTDVRNVDDAESAASDAVSACGFEGTVYRSRAVDGGARVEPDGRPVVAHDPPRGVTVRQRSP